MRTIQELTQRLIGRIEESMYVRGATLDKKFILGGTGGDLGIAKSCLEKWAAEGKCRILKPIEDAEDDENVVTMITYITKQIPWPYPPKS
jgi:hypothetical protein